MSFELIQFIIKSMVYSMKSLYIWNTTIVSQTDSILYLEFWLICQITLTTKIILNQMIFVTKTCESQNENLTLLLYSLKKHYLHLYTYLYDNVLFYRNTVWIAFKISNFQYYALITKWNGYHNRVFWTLNMNKILWLWLPNVMLQLEWKCRSMILWYS